MKRVSAALLSVCLVSLVSAATGQKVERCAILKEKNWQWEYQSCIPDPALLESLKAKLAAPLKVVVYFGFWCGDSQHNVPRFLKIIDQLPAQNLELEFFACERKTGKEQKYYVEDFQVEKVPTFIFYRAGKEIGRIVENPKTDMLEDFLTIVF